LNLNDISFLRDNVADVLSHFFFGAAAVVLHGVERFERFMEACLVERINHFLRLNIVLTIPIISKKASASVYFYNIGVFFY